MGENTLSELTISHYEKEKSLIVEKYKSLFLLLDKTGESTGLRQKLLRLDELIYEYNFTKSYIDFTNIEMSLDDSLIMMKIDQLVSKLEKSIIGQDFNSIAEFPVIRKQLLDNAKQAATAVYIQESASSKRHLDLTLPVAKRPKALQTWSKEHVKCVFDATKSSTPWAEIQRLFMARFDTCIDQSFGNYLLSHYGAKRYINQRHNRKVDEIYLDFKDLSHTRVVDKVRFLTNISRNEAEMACEFRRLIFNRYSTLPEPESNYVEYFGKPTQASVSTKTNTSSGNVNDAQVSVKDTEGEIRTGVSPLDFSIPTSISLMKYNSPMQENKTNGVVNTILAQKASTSMVGSPLQSIKPIEKLSTVPGTSRPFMTQSALVDLSGGRSPSPVNTFQDPITLQPKLVDGSPSLKSLPKPPSNEQKLHYGDLHSVTQTPKPKSLNALASRSRSHTPPDKYTTYSPSTENRRSSPLSLDSYPLTRSTTPKKQATILWDSRTEEIFRKAIKVVPKVHNRYAVMAKFIRSITGNVVTEAQIAQRMECTTNAPKGATVEAPIIVNDVGEIEPEVITSIPIYADPLQCNLEMVMSKIVRSSVGSNDYYISRFANLKPSGYWAFDLNKILVTTVEFLTLDHHDISAGLLSLGRSHILDIIVLRLYREQRMSVSKGLIRNRLNTMMDHDVFSHVSCNMLNTNITW